MYVFSKPKHRGTEISSGYLSENAISSWGVSGNVLVLMHTLISLNRSQGPPQPLYPTLEKSLAEMGKTVYK